MKIFRKLLRFFILLLALPVGYLLVSLVLTSITIESQSDDLPKDHIVYLNTNGVHLDVVIPKIEISEELTKGLKMNSEDQYISFGWGDENFYLNTPTWGDLTISNACSALFLKSSTLMHITRYTTFQSDWIAVELSISQLERLNTYLESSFRTDLSGAKIIMPDAGYSTHDDFYKANGSYSCLKTCNSWVNTGFKESGLKACLWTPFDFGLMNKYDKE